MPEPTTAAPPSAAVPPAELPASLRDAGLANWIREPLDDAVDRRRQILSPPAVATMGTRWATARERCWPRRGAPTRCS